MLCESIQAIQQPLSKRSTQGCILPSATATAIPWMLVFQQTCWIQQVGWHSSETVQECRIPGYRTNHSLRATTATRLYQAGVDEQLVMEQTGHQSLEGVRSYKRTSTDQQESMSNILNGTITAQTTTDKCDSVVPRVNTFDIDSSREGCMVQVNNHIAHTSNSLSNNVVVQPPPAFNFHSCSVTINYVTQPQH